MISPKGISLIVQFESLKTRAYPDPKSGGEPWTIGCGHTDGVKPGDVCTDEEALDWLREDCADAELCIEAHIEVPLNQNQRDALISFVYNLGCEKVKNSTLFHLINSGQYAAAAQQFLRWVSPGSAVEKGLLRRRTAEMKLFMELEA